MTGITLIICRRGAGKSTLLRSLLEQEAPRRWVVVDPMREHAALGGVVARTFSSMRDLLYARTPAMRIVYQPSEAPINARFDELAGALYEVGDYTFAVDELDLFAPLHDIPRNFLACVQQGRHRNLRIIGATRRFADISKSISSQAEEAFLGAMHEPRDLEYLRKAFGDAASRAADLPKFSWIHWRDGEVISAPAPDAAPALEDESEAEAPAEEISEEVTA